MAHTNDRVCLTVVIFLRRGGKVLLANHPKYNAWLPIGGHIDPGEDTDEALYREIKEEANLKTEDIKICGEKATIPQGNQRSLLSTPAYVDRHAIQDRDHVALVYFGELREGCEPSLSDEHVELRWFSKDELANKDGLLKPDIAWYAREALRM